MSDYDVGDAAAARDAASASPTLCRLGVERGRCRSAVMLPNGAELVASLFGVWMAGGCTCRSTRGPSAERAGDGRWSTGASS